jgi:high-affinity Fe2+/Pb2+ permease
MTAAEVLVLSSMTFLSGVVTLAVLAGLLVLGEWAIHARAASPRRHARKMRR